MRFELFFLPKIAMCIPSLYHAHLRSLSVNNLLNIKAVHIVMIDLLNASIHTAVFHTSACAEFDRLLYTILSHRALSLHDTCRAIFSSGDQLFHLL